MTTKVSSAMQDLTDDYAFSGTVSGAGKVVQVVNVMDGAVATGTTAIPFDDTIPQITEGVELMTLAITPTNASNILLIEVVAMLSIAGTGKLHCLALFQDSTAGALASAIQDCPISTERAMIGFNHYMVAGVAVSTTFRFRAGAFDTTTMTFNGSSGGRYHGGALASSITITEIAV